MPLPQERLYTLEEVLSWDGPESFELIGGVPLLMATPARVHQEISGELHGQLREYLRGKTCRVYAAPFAVRLFEQDDHTMVIPDISVICDPKKLDDIGCKGAPDFIIEILSPSSQRHDKLTKFNLYQRAGVREYWIVDPASKSVQAFVLEDGRYTAKDFGEAGDKLRVSVLEDCVVDLAEVFAE